MTFFINGNESKQKKKNIFDAGHLNAKQGLIKKFFLTLEQYEKKRRRRKRIKQKLEFWVECDCTRDIKQLL